MACTATGGGESVTVQNAFKLLSAVRATDRLRQLTKPQLIQVIGDLRVMLARTEDERSSRFDGVVGKMVQRQAGQKRTEQGKRTKQLEEDKRWLEERRRRMEAMASDFQRERAAAVIQRCVRRHLRRCRADPRWRRQRGQQELMQRLKYDFERRGAVLAATLAKDQEPQVVAETLSDEGRGELLRTPDQAAAVIKAGN